jgi:hypothetical protein
LCKASPGFKFHIMNRIFYILSSFILLLCIEGKSQSLGFKESECNIVSNPNYYIENYQSSHWAGYRIHHNGSVIAERVGFGGYSGKVLRFIDDTTGFLIVQDYTGFFLEIYKIMNDSVVLLGYIPHSNLDGDYDFFIVTRHTLYVESDIVPPNPNTLFISRFSDLLPQKNIVYYYPLTADTTVFDTVAGVPFCPDLNEINYRFKLAADTLNYKIRFKVDTLENTGKLTIPGITLYPNPAHEVIRVRAIPNETRGSIKILDNLGRSIKSIVMNSSGDTEIFIGDLKQGIYYVILDNNKTTKVFKLVKI